MGRERAAQLKKNRKSGRKIEASRPHRRRVADIPLSNRSIAELLARAGEAEEGYKRKAFFRAAHAAFLWPEEAATLLLENRSLAELPAVGPFLAKTIATWIGDPPEIPNPPLERRNFLTLTEARAVIETHPDWRMKLKGDLQMHTEWSDGDGTIREMADAGLSRGYEYIAITDHTKALKIAGGIDEIELAKQAEEIETVNADLARAGKSFRVLRSVELNLSPTGEGDIDCQFLDGLDIVLGSFHSALRVTTDQTARYLAALENRCVQILGHPRGRVYNYRPGLQADWRRVFARAAELDKAVEIDAYSDRQDLDVELLQIAAKEGVRISFGSDAHHAWQLVFLDLALGAALLAGIAPDRIINFLSVEQLLDWVHSTRHR